MPLVPHVTPASVIASTWGNLVADHVVMRFTTAAQRTSQLTAPLVGQLTTLDTAPGVVEFWTGTAWAPAVGPRQLAYAELTTSKTVSQAAEATADLVVAAPATTFDGGPIVVEFSAAAVVPASAAGALVMLWLYQDGTSLGRLATVLTPVAAQLVVPVHAQRRLTPTAGSHTYTVGATQTGGNGTVFGGPGGTAQYVPAFIRITRAA
jgi:hypothetical protein